VGAVALPDLFVGELGEADGEVAGHLLEFVA
jgi:hypothetical protein